MCNIGFSTCVVFGTKDAAFLTSASRTFSDLKTVIQKGSVVMASVDAIHRDETVYPNLWAPGALQI
jgi:hypothetical protein